MKTSENFLWPDDYSDEIAKALSGELSKITSETELPSGIRNLSLLGEPDSPNSCSYFENEKFYPLLKTSKSRVIICRPQDANRIRQLGKTPIVNLAPSVTYFKIHNELAKIRLSALPKTVIENGAVIHPTSQISEFGVYISSGCYIGANSTICERVILGADTKIHEGAVIGSVGFEYKRNDHEEFLTVTHDGFVEISEDCVIGANSVIGQGFWKKPTLIERNTKIDHLVGISHGSSIGESNLIAAGAVVSGSVKTGRNVWIGPGSRITNGAVIGDNSRVGIGSVVIKNVEPNTSVFGVPARTF